jgi:phosphatidylserine/phosphatidylglycerophosphate/cardiolipin synthase-like enzyme
MAQINSFQVGGVPLDSKISKAFLEQMKANVEKAELSEGKESAAAALKEIYETGHMSEGGLESLKGYGKATEKEWKNDKDAIWAAKEAKPGTVEAGVIEARRKDLNANAPFLGNYNVFIDDLREKTALAAVQAVASSGFGPVSLVAGYAAYLNGPTWDKSATKKTTELVTTYEKYLAGDSVMTTKGNSVQQVHRSELWKTLTGLTREAAQSGKAGKPQDIIAQYYELTSPEVVGNLAEAAKAGSKLRLNLDAGRLSYPATDTVTGTDYFQVDEIAKKMRTVVQFTSIEGADVGVSLFPSKGELGSAEDLMHRKVLRVGDKVLMSGMNANASSGENVDAGYVIEGPAARNFAQNAARDIAASAGAGTEEIWGKKQFEKFDVADLRMSKAGLLSLFDTLQGGPSPAGSVLSSPKTVEDLEAAAKKAGVELASVINVPQENWAASMDALLNHDGVVSLSTEGKGVLKALMERAVAETQTPENLKALADISLPKGDEVGKTVVDIADQPAERETLTLNAIAQAKEFIYMPGFVVTRAVAAAIVAKQEQAIKEGKPLDIKVVADSGIYPFGGTPNSSGVDYLEEHGIPVRWAQLERTGPHDRKVHAKQILTDQGEIAGSTNFSAKGMRENWETSAYVHFDENDKDSQALKAQSKAQFEQLWEKDCYPVSITDLARIYSKNEQADGHEHFVSSARAGATREVLVAIENYEVETGDLMQRLLEREGVADKRKALIADGYSDGDAMLMAADSVIGEKELDKMKSALPSSLELERLRGKVEKWKAKGE